MKHANRFWRPSVLDCVGPWAQRERYPLIAEREGDGDWYVVCDLNPLALGPRRRCRRVTGGDVLLDIAANGIADEVSDAVNEGAVGHAFGDYANGIEVRVLPGGDDALLDWADKYLEIDAWIREGDE